MTTTQTVGGALPALAEDAAAELRVAVIHFPDGSP
jgi:hypothetical protein